MVPSVQRDSGSETSSCSRALTGRTQGPGLPSASISLPAIQLPPNLRELAKHTIRLVDTSGVICVPEITYTLTPGTTSSANRVRWAISKSGGEMITSLQPAFTTDCSRATHVSRSSICGVGVRVEGGAVD